MGWVNANMENRHNSTPKPLYRKNISSKKLDVLNLEQTASKSN
jgi:hypothetical protein